MLLNTAPANEAVLGNVGEVGDFKIKASAKAFSILSSGLYANKIRAIIRELSCNAVDSHVAAGNTETPFDVHLPNTLEPWFSIRDYGTGLNHEQVTSIYTTYFESTKTDSNDYIGALGLGSKSPFSYTDNFTVTAVKDGKKGIYTAFINGDGVPSIALMMSEDTTDPSGVEIKFSVNDTHDYSKFRDEARKVYTYFANRPVVSGAAGFEFNDVEYETIDIVPGVNSVVQGSWRSGSIAVMGNIAYPLDVPNADKTLGPLESLLQCNLELRFDIGELDFQASREGLSYIPQTIEAIKRKLESVNDQLTVRLAEEADKIKNAWERALFLQKKRDTRLWMTATEKYLATTKFELFFSPHPGHSVRLKSFSLFEKELADNLNIKISAFTKSRGDRGTSTCRIGTNWELKDENDRAIVRNVWNVSINAGARFVINDTKVGATERAKYHWNTVGLDKDGPYNNTVYVLEPVDKTKVMNTGEFFQLISNPPQSFIVKASELQQKVRQTVSKKDATILHLERKGYGSYYKQGDLVWRDAGKANSFRTDTTHYYVPLNAFQIDSERFKDTAAKTLIEKLNDSGIAELKEITVYGVRKTDIKTISEMANWVPVEDYILEVLTGLTAEDKFKLAGNTLDSGELLSYNSSLNEYVKETSPYRLATESTKGVAPHKKVDWRNVSWLLDKFGVAEEIEKLRDGILEKHAELKLRYPLLSSLNHYPDTQAVAEYINLIDEKKGV